MKKYKVASESGVILEDGVVVHAIGTVIESEPTALVEALIANGALEEIVEESPKVDAQTAAPVNATGATSDTTASQAEEIPAEEEKVSPTEPRLRYRGQLVLSESERTVGAQTFKHIRIADGSEYDMTDREYATEVRMSYPPEV